MKCRSCEQEFDNSVHTKICPNCKTPIKPIKEITIPDVIQIVIEEKGKEILNEPKIVYNYVADYFHGNESDKSLFKIACNNNILSAGYKILSTDSEEEKSAIIKQQYKKLQQTAFLSSEYAEKAVNFVLEGIGIEIKTEEPSVKPADTTQNSRTVKSNKPPVYSEKKINDYVKFWRYWIPKCLNLSVFHGKNYYIDFHKNITVPMRTAAFASISKQGLYPDDLIALVCETGKNKEIISGILFTFSSVYISIPNSINSKFSRLSSVKIDYTDIISAEFAGTMLKIETDSPTAVRNTFTFDFKNFYIFPVPFAEALMRFTNFIKII